MPGAVLLTAARREATKLRPTPLCSPGPRQRSETGRVPKPYGLVQVGCCRRQRKAQATPRLTASANGRVAELGRRATPPYSST